MGPIPPGASASAVVTAEDDSSLVSLVGMLIHTIDGFYALNGVAIPEDGWVAYLSPAYDAGSEANTEDCAHIPGPFCGNPFNRVTVGAEGYVHIHAGVHGIGTGATNLIRATHDWRNPVARITIRRLGGDADD